jgi:hypothetical protein
MRQRPLVGWQRGGLADLPLHGTGQRWFLVTPDLKMEAIRAPANRYRIWFGIEVLAAQGMARTGR